MMRKNSWNDQRIIFWSSVYAYLVEDYRKKGMSIHKTTMKKPVNDLCVKVGEQIKTVRKQNRLTQSDLSKKIGISQQMISRIERGQENLSILTLNTVTAGLGKTVVLNLK